MMDYFGIRIIESPMALAQVERRVKGGYNNNWLIRKLVMEPCLIRNNRDGVIYAHPTLHKKIWEQIRSQDASLFHQVPGLRTFGLY